MADFLDIAPLFEKATVRGHEVTVRGVELADIAEIIFRYPELGVMFAAKKPDFAVLKGLSKSIQAALIAGGIDELDEKGAANLTPGERSALMLPIFKLTVPSPAGPFMEALIELVNQRANENENQN